MKFKQENFVVTVENLDSPVIMTIPHGGMNKMYGSWLKNIFIPRPKYHYLDENVLGEKIVLGGDNRILHVGMDVLSGYDLNVVAGLLPRMYVDYNRFITEVAYFDGRLQPFYNAYHDAVSRSIESILKRHKNVFLIDLHGFGKFPADGVEFDLVISTNNGRSCPNNYDMIFYKYFSDNYKVFSSSLNPPPINVPYKGDTTSLHYFKKYGIDTMILEVSPRFRLGRESMNLGTKLSLDIANFLNTYFQVLDS